MSGWSTRIEAGGRKRHIYPWWRSSSAAEERARRRRARRAPRAAARPPTACLAQQLAHHIQFQGFYNPPITFLICASENFWTHQLSACFSAALGALSTRRARLETHFMRNTRGQTLRRRGRGSRTSRFGKITITTARECRHVEIRNTFT